MLQRYLLALCTLAISGCGVRPPPIAEIWQGEKGTRNLEFEIRRRVYCELKHAVADADTNMTHQTIDRDTGVITRQPLIPNDWGAQISLQLQVEESTSLNPGVAITNPMSNAVTAFTNGNITTPRSFSLGLGATLSSTATRIDKFNPFYTVDFLRSKETDKSICKDENDPILKEDPSVSTGSMALLSQLGLSRWLQDALFSNDLLPSDNPSASNNKSLPDTISIDIKFVVVSSANINPVWKLLPITFNNGSASLLSTGRTRTHDLLITLGPNDPKTTNAHLASQIGQAITNANQIIP